MQFACVPKMFLRKLFLKLSKFREKPPSRSGDIKNFRPGVWGGWETGEHSPPAPPFPFLMCNMILYTYVRNLHEQVMKMAPGAYFKILKPHLRKIKKPNCMARRSKKIITFMGTNFKFFFATSKGSSCDTRFS